jgi:ubiquinone biosynthesis protein
LNRLEIRKYVRTGRRRTQNQKSAIHNLTAPQRLRSALEELGPTFIKLGQILSTRPDLLPQEYITELVKLLEHASPVSIQTIVETVEYELNRPIHEVFSSFDKEPVASASLSQVHKAVLKTNETVAVKVQRPNIVGIIEADLEIMYILVSLAQHQLQKFGISDPVGLVNEFSNTLGKELDFRLEANNIQQFRDNFRNEKYVYIPDVYDELCTRRLLTMEFISGIGISNTESLCRKGYNLELIAQRCADVLLKSTLEQGFFHADPHPGNIYVLPDNMICLLDYGMIGRVSTNQREKLAWLMYYIAHSDEKRASRTLIDLAQSAGTVNRKALEIEAGNLISEYSGLPVNELNLGTLLPRLWQLLKENDIHLNTHLIWLLKAVATGDDIARRLQADFNMVEYTRPYAQRVIRHNLSPMRQVRELQLMVLDLMDLLRDMPYEARVIINQLTEGKLKIDFEHIGLEPLRKTLHQITNRLAIAVIVASLIVGSSLIVLSGVPPLISNVPVIGLAGYIISGLFALWLIISILRSDKK